MKGLHLHLDMPSGIAGDMTLGALFDLGVPEDVVRDELARLPVEGYQLVVKRATRSGMAGVDVKVMVDEGAQSPGHHHHRDHAHDHHGHDHHDGGHDHRHWGEIRQMLQSLSPAVRDLAVRIFQRLADAEAKMHAVPVDQVAFHEVGAIDSIVDIVGTAAAVAWLAPASVSASPVATGQGTVETQHGRLPVPAPATLEILRAAGVPSIPGGVDKELCTPTGAAIVAALAGSFGPMPPMTAVAVGYGAGDRELPDRPNLLRATLGRPHASAGTDAELYQLEANLDDMSPEICAYVAERLFEAGALDVWWTPVTMKKSRPGLVLSVLGADRDALGALVLAETTTLGVRSWAVSRRVLDRRVETVETEHGPVQVKLGLLGDRVVNVAPEYESCRKVAREKEVALKDVYAAAVRAYHARG